MIFDDAELERLSRMIGSISDAPTRRLLDRLVVLLEILERKVNENCGVRDDD